eukprot:1600973-Prymnesium_polylepis.1
MVRVYCAHGFNSGFCPPARRRGASHAVFTYRSAAAAGRSMAHSDSVHGVQNLRERNEKDKCHGTHGRARRDVVPCADAR